MCPGTEAIKRPGFHLPALGVNPEDTRKDETQSLELGRTWRPLGDSQASPFLSLQVLLRRANLEQSICGALLYAQVSEGLLCPGGRVGDGLGRAEA